MVELKVRLGPKGQVVIPKIFRNMFKMHPGSEIIITFEKDKGVVIKKTEGRIAEKFKEIATEVSKERKGKKFSYNKNEFYEQYEKREKRAGL
ncbi:AbrB/MazE/SpoVT family DNA-binding domain-containing protein [Candidatus Pacearchaeota archaeon]|nr:AbrB/MazE/SpoVT family DNA-binding domain-containing protein [Candidatus Pacearchaeota archaeon]